MISFNSPWMFYKRQEIHQEEPTEIVKDYKLLDYLMIGLAVFTF